MGALVIIGILYVLTEYPLTQAIRRDWSLK